MLHLRIGSCCFQKILLINDVMLMNSIILSCWAVVFWRCFSSRNSQIVLIIKHDCKRQRIISKHALSKSRVYEIQLCSALEKKNLFLKSCSLIVPFYSVVTFGIPLMQSNFNVFLNASVDRAPCTLSIVSCIWE